MKVGGGEREVEARWRGGGGDEISWKSKRFVCMGQRQGLGCMVWLQRQKDVFLNSFWVIYKITGTPPVVSAPVLVFGFVYLFLQ